MTAECSLKLWHWGGGGQSVTADLEGAQGSSDVRKPGAEQEGFELQAQVKYPHTAD